MLEPGTVLDERYEIIDVVGTGGMSTVYRAKDERLKRYVAVKVLKADYSQDATFVSKFRAEAQNSAGLIHPNIVSVYDVCEDQGLYFIVMELVEGITLKEYINLNGRLGMDQAIDFSIQIASALEAAHEHHVIHRDIKPQNIIVAKNGNIKVTDFGIAKAATSTTMSTTGIGSVHYISPEQARGGYSDERSDIYSLGITMYEMVTGRVPFEGDTNVAIALMHIQNDITPPRELYPDIYPSFEKIILKCTQKKPERRYLTAAALIADLQRVKENPNIDIVVAPAGVTNAPTQMFSADDMAKIKEQSANKKVDDETLMAAGIGGHGQEGSRTPAGSGAEPDRRKLDQLLQKSEEDDFFDDERAGQSAPMDGGDEDWDDSDDIRDRNFRGTESQGGRNYRTPDLEEDEEEEEPPKTGKAVMVGGILAAIIIVLVVFLVLGNILGWFDFGSGNKTTENSSITTETSTEEESAPMPDVVGLTQKAAQNTFKAAGFMNVNYQTEASSDVREDYVIRTSEEAGKVLPLSTEITVYVSSGPDAKTVPDVTNMTEEDAKETLENAGFKATSRHEYSDDVDEGLVISQDPAGNSDAEEGTTITLTVSNGPKKKDVEVPDLSGQTESAARESLEAVKLKAGEVTYEFNSDVAAGTVIRQTIASGTSTKEGTAVGFTISKGPETKTYTANVSGMLTASGMDFLSDQSSAVVTVYVNDAAGSHQIAQNTVTGMGLANIQVTGSYPGLTSNQGTLTFTVVDSSGADLTSYYSNGLTLSYAEQ